MRWRDRSGSSNVEDRRATPARGAIAGTSGLGVLAIVLIGYFLGFDVSPITDEAAPRAEVAAADEHAAEFVSVVLADTERVWSGVFRDQIGAVYTPTTLVLYKGVTQSACGGASGATGPFYCPGDGKIYLDTEFFTTLSERLGARGDFAAAYVVAHEVGHHVQDELGVLSQAHALQARLGEAEANEVSVRIELQADCLAGIWARHVEDRFGALEPGDVAEAMNAAKQIGDDTLQRRAGGVPMPHTFTHGTSEQRQRWFATGFESGQLGSCDTFDTEEI